MQPSFIGKLLLAVLGFLPEQPDTPPELLKMPLTLGVAIGCHPFDRRHERAAVHSTDGAVCGEYAADRLKDLENRA